MRYIKVVMDTCYCGTREEEYLIAEDNITEDEINQWVEGMAEDHADMYSYLATDDIDEDDYSTEEEYEEACSEAAADYYENSVYYSWEEISKEEIEEIKTWVELRKIEV